MFAVSTRPKAGVSRRDAEEKLIGNRTRYLRFLRKRLNSVQDVEDVFQDFCVKVLRNHSLITNGERLDAWLGITLRHTLTDHYRRQATRRRGSQNFATEARILDPAAGDIEEPACRCVSLALERLEPAQAELLSRLDLQEEPRKAVAADLGVNLNTLGVRVHRSRVALKKQIAELCPICGEGGFMQCDCDRSSDIRSLSVPPQANWQAAAAI